MFILTYLHTQNFSWYLSHDVCCWYYSSLNDIQPPKTSTLYTCLHRVYCPHPRSSIQAGHQLRGSETPEESASLGVTDELWVCYTLQVISQLNLIQGRCVNVIFYWFGSTVSHTFGVPLFNEVDSLLKSISLTHWITTQQV